MVSTANLIVIDELAKCINKHQLTLRGAYKYIQHSVVVNIILSTFHIEQKHQLNRHLSREHCNDSGQMITSSAQCRIFV